MSRIYILDNRRTDLLYFTTLAGVCKFLGYKNIRGFKPGNAYRGYIFYKTNYNSICNSNK